MTFLQEVYDENKKLDKLFDADYDNNSDKTMKDNILELLVEIGEFCNETRCFKYWSNKKVNKELALEEFADCILMLLCFYNTKDISLDDNFKQFDSDIIDSFMKLYQVSSMLTTTLDADILKDTLSYLIHISELLNYTKEEIKDACLKKIKKNYSRFDSQEFGKLNNN